MCLEPYLATTASPPLRWIFAAASGVITRKPFIIFFLQKGSNHNIVHFDLNVLFRPDSTCGLARIHCCNRTLALRLVPKCRRAAILLIVSVVSRLSRPAIASFSGSLLRRRASSSSGHPNRPNSSETIRSALLSAVSKRRSPE
jgi:hypothetical protein